MIKKVNNLNLNDVHSSAQVQRINQNLNRKVEYFSQEGVVDSAARLAMEAEIHVKDGKLVEAEHTFIEAGNLITIEMNKMRQQPRNQVDQLSIDVMKALADDYRRQSKLLKIQSEAGVNKAKEKLSLMQESHRERKRQIEKAKREGKPIDESLLDPNPQSELQQVLYKRLAQHMMIVKAEAIQEIHDAYTEILADQTQFIEDIMQYLMATNYKLQGMQDAQNQQLLVQNGLDKSVFLQTSDENSKFLDVNHGQLDPKNPFASDVRKQSIPTNKKSQLEIVMQQTNISIQKMKEETQNYIKSIKRQKNKLQNDFEEKVGKCFEHEIVENTLILKLDDFYNLGTTAIGKEMKIIDKLFSPDEVQLLSVKSQDHFRDLEQSIMMNESVMQMKKRNSSGKGSNSRRQSSGKNIR